MSPFLLFLALAVPASAQDLAPKPSAKGWYRTVREFREAGVVRRKNFPVDYTLEAKSKYLYCMIPPGADWALESQEEHVEEQYLRLLAAATHLDALALHDKDQGTSKDDGKLSADPAQRFVEPSSGVIGFCGTLRSPTPRVDLDRVDAAWRAECQTPVEAPQPGRFACTAFSGGTVFPPKLVAVTTLKALAASPHVKTANRALGLMEEIKGRDRFFAKTVSEILLDKNTPPAVRERAAEVLASVHTHDLSGITLATIWGDEKNTASLRRAALRGYSLIMSFADQRGGKGSAEAVRDRLRKYLPALAAVVKAETKEEKNGADKLTPLGEDAKCVAQQYSVRWLCYMNRYGPKWYEELKVDESKGLDACAKDGKLK